MTSISPHWSSSTNSEVVTLPCQLSLGYCFCGYDSTNNEKHHNRHSVTKRPYCIEFNCSLRSMTWTFSYLNYGNNMRKCMNESNSKIVAYATTMTRQVVSYSIVVTDSRSEFHICCNTLQYLTMRKHTPIALHISQKVIFLFWATFSF